MTAQISNSAISGANIAIIGGGPAGLMAAGRAAELGAAVTLIEKNSTPGRKLLLTGGGRCNVTSSSSLKQFVAAFGDNGNFLYRALAAFSPAELIKFLKSRGVPTRTDPDGKIFPSNDRASSVLAALKSFAAGSGVKILHNSAAAELLCGDAVVIGVKLANGDVISAQKVIVATGGLSYPETGSTGDGYAFARQCGHTIAPLKPGLIPLESDEWFVSKLQGLALKNISITIMADGKKTLSANGDLIFTHFGLSGPQILVLSAAAVDALEQNRRVDVSLNLTPGLTAEQFQAELQSYFARNGAKLFSSYLKETLPKSLAVVMAGRCALQHTRKCAGITAGERAKIARLFCDFRMHITKPRGIGEATITRGGVSLSEIDPHTMQSRLVDGLYFCGEVLDLAGITGGYNLQEAFSTGWLAGESAAGSG
ncbi:MAG: NAD(P)/FAD-dependent oxidoreductase [Elusimicrobiaceae bacterium]|nr:NAD(P)/FAD-dependent oxidoreductase [Elusimicrobiaceae bacterium]